VIDVGRVIWEKRNRRLAVGIISYGVAAGTLFPPQGGVLKAVLVLQGGLGVVVTFN